MALTEETVEDKIEIVSEHKMIQVRTATVIKRDDVEISRSFHRHVLAPCAKTDDTWADTDISGEAAGVQAIANAAWTDDVKAAYKAMREAQEV